MLPIGAFIGDAFPKVEDDRPIPIFIDSTVTNLLQDTHKKITGVEVNNARRIRDKRGFA